MLFVFLYLITRKLNEPAQTSQAKLAFWLVKRAEPAHYPALSPALRNQVACIMHPFFSQKNNGTDKQ